MSDTKWQWQWADLMPPGTPHVMTDQIAKMAADAMDRAERQNGIKLGNEVVVWESKPHGEIVSVTREVVE